MISYDHYKNGNPPVINPCQIRLVSQLLRHLRSTELPQQRHSGAGALEKRGAAEESMGRSIEKSKKTWWLPWFLSDFWEFIPVFLEHGTWVGRFQVNMFGVPKEI